MITEWQIALRLLAAAVLGGLVGEVEQILQDLGIGIKSINVSKDMENNEVEVEAITKVPSQQSTDKLISRLSHIQGIQGFEIQ